MEDLSNIDMKDLYPTDAEELIEQLIERAKKLSELMKNERIQRDWKLLRHDIINHYNYNDIFKTIVVASLHITADNMNPGQNPEFKRRLINNATIRWLIDNKVVTMNDINTLSCKRWIELEQEEYKSLLESKISYERVKEEPYVRELIRKNHYTENGLKQLTYRELFNSRENVSSP